MYTFSTRYTQQPSHRRAQALRTAPSTRRVEYDECDMRWHAEWRKRMRWENSKKIMERRKNLWQKKIIQNMLPFVYVRFKRLLAHTRAQLLYVCCVYSTRCMCVTTFNEEVWPVLIYCVPRTVQTILIKEKLSFCIYTCTTSTPQHKGERHKIYYIYGAQIISLAFMCAVWLIKWNKHFFFRLKPFKCKSN